MKEKTLALSYYKYIIRFIKSVKMRTVKKLTFELYRYIQSIATLTAKIHFSIDNAIIIKLKT